MKKILVPGRSKGFVMFQCPVCGCIFESDKYVSKRLNELIHVEKDECPNCKMVCSVYTGDAEDGE